MEQLKPDSVTDQEMDEFISWLAGEIKQRGLESVAQLILETHRPIGNIMSHLCLFFSPFVLAFFGSEKTSVLVSLLSDPVKVEKLQQKLDHF